MPNHPLAEVFGYPVDNFSDEAQRGRAHRLCPFHNKSPNCTKASVEHPIGVCSVFHGDDVAITCPIRFREGWQIATDAAAFFFEPGATWAAVPEVRLNDRDGNSAGNIDLVLVAYDEIGRVVDYGALEVQAVYISGNISVPFRHYMEAPEQRADMDWRRQPSYPRPDYLSSSRKRLAPQLIYKGGILKEWERKTAVALHQGFYNTLPELGEVVPEEADVAWFVYDLQRDEAAQRYRLRNVRTVYTRFEDALERITRSKAGNEAAFIRRLERKLKTTLDEGNSLSFGGLTAGD